MIVLQRTPADIAMSLLVRYQAGWRCEVCGTPFAERSPLLDNSHFWPRGDAFRPTRYVLENCLAACRRCHQIIGDNANRFFYKALMIKRLGQEGFDLLSQLAHSIVPRRLIDEAEIARRYREALRKEFGVVVSGRGPALSTFFPGATA